MRHPGSILSLSHTARARGASQGRADSKGRLALGSRKRVHGLAGSLMVLLVAACAGGQAPRDDDPLPVLRVIIPPEQVVQELARLKQGALVKLSRDEFETRVRKAAAAGARMKT